MLRPGERQSGVHEMNNRIKPDSKAGKHQPEAKSPYGMHYTIG
jgi:hypothetical protein